ncbi:MAG: hypothetical protein Q8P72_03970 [Candidatus Roizmanbacteria bacterium]|nr:hypothetical protein [Candidatus Roizmanbacteria bacterium]
MLTFVAAIFRSFSPLFLIIKRTLIVVFVLTAVISIFVHLSRTDRPTLNLQAYRDYQDAQIYGPLTDSRLTETDQGKVMGLAYRGTLCSLFGETCTNNPSDAAKFKDGSLFGSVSGLMATPYSNPPASGLAWAREGLASSGLIPSAYASEGIGFSSIKGFLSVWTGFRNISLLLLVMLTVILGFMVMFRSKMGGQTAVSLDSILPRIVITMILISFSFAIAGFMIDLMYVTIGLVVDILLGYGLNFPVEQVASIQDDFIGAKLHDLWPQGSFWGGGASPSAFSVGSAMWDFVPVEFKGILDLVVMRTLSQFLANTWLAKWFHLADTTANIGWTGGALTFVTGLNIGGINSSFWKWVFTMLGTGLLSWILPALIIGLLIILTILLHMFKIFFILLASYIKIMLYIMFAPIIILFEVIPGQNAFGWWFKNLVGELIAFPTVVTIMLTGQVIMMINTAGRFGTGSLGSSYSTLGQNILPGSLPFTLPFLYGFRPEDFNMIVALGLILITPDFIKIVKAKIGVQESPLNFGLGTFFAGAGIFMSGLGTASQLQGFRQAAVGHDMTKGWLHTLFPAWAEKIRTGGVISNTITETQHRQ